jgi:hypothetical protein
MTLRECTLLARKFYRAGWEYKTSILKAIRAFEIGGQQFSFQSVNSDWKALRAERSKKVVPKSNEITLRCLENGLVEVSQAGVTVVLLLEEAKDQYPWFFED